MRRPPLAMVLLVLLLTGGLTGCAGPSSATTSEPTAAPSAASPSSRSPSSASPSSASASSARVSRDAAPRSPLHVVALGDSVTAGSGCDCVSFPNLYATALGQREQAGVVLSDQGEPGATSADLVEELPDLTEDLQQADVVLVTIGANDFSDSSAAVLDQTCGGADGLTCTRESLLRLEADLTAIVSCIQRDRGDQPATVLLTGYWNVLLDGDVAARDYTAGGRAASVTLTRAVNSVIEQTAQRSRVRYVDLHTAFEGSRGDQDPTPLLADDGDHPSAAGHQLIASALLSATPPPNR